MLSMVLQVVVDAIDPTVLVSQCASKTFDFGSVTEPQLTNFTIPLQLQIGGSCTFALCPAGSDSPQIYADL